MLEQTKRAIAAMKKSGFSRNQFSVRTEKDKNGEYGRTYVSIRGILKPHADKIPAMIATGDLDVKVLTENGEFRTMIVKSGNGKLTYWDIAK